MSLEKLFWMLWMIGISASVSLAASPEIHEEENYIKEAWDKIAHTAKVQDTIPQHQPEDVLNDKHDTIEGRKSNSNSSPNLSYFLCQTINYVVGACRPIEHCNHKELFINYNTYKRYACKLPIKPTTYGVCCPDLAPLPKSTVQDVDPTTVDTECGISAKNTNMRIVGGKRALIGEFPWMISLMRMNTNPLHNCGATLISPWHALTAAHCFHDTGLTTNNTWARLGEYDSQREGESPHIERRIAKIVTHPEFNYRNYNNDIVVLTFDAPVRFNDYIRPVCLPQPHMQGSEDFWARKKATIAGWGVTKYRGSYSSSLLKVSFPIWPRNSCKQIYGRRLKDSMLCAGVAEGGKDACQDDSGGPMLVEEDGLTTLVGIVSWGIRCAMKNKPGLYTDVSYFHDWIQQQISLY